MERHVRAGWEDEEGGGAGEEEGEEGQEGNERAAGR